MSEKRLTNQDGAPAFEALQSTEDFGGSEELREEREKKEKLARRLRVLGLGGSVVLLCGGLAGLVLVSLQKKEEADPAPASPVKSSPKPALSQSDAQLIWGTILKSREVAKRFYAAKTMDERSALIRDPERVMPLMREFYKRTEFGTFEPREIGIEAAYQVDDPKSGASLVFTWAIIEDFTRRLFVCEQSAEGDVRLDWESLVGYCSMSWEAFQSERPTESQVFRVVANAGGYYVAPFDDRDEHSSYRLADSSKGQLLHGYCGKNSDLDQLMHKHLQRGKEQQLTLELRYPEGAEVGNQVEIVQILGASWVLGFGDQPTFKPSRFLLLAE